MNIFEIFSINKHGDYQEILFSSALSYLVNPVCKNGLGHTLLKDFLESIGISLTKEDYSHIEVESECDLGEMLDNTIGRIDIAVKTKSTIIGIELKIWDRSANNTSSDGEEQLLRYARGLKAIAQNEDKDWKLVFIVPHYGTKICSKEYRKLSKEYAGHCTVLPLMKLKKGDQNLFSNLEGYSNKSVPGILSNFMKNTTFSDSKTKSILEDLVDFLTNDVENRLYKSNPDPQKFPNDCELQANCSEFYNILSPFISVTGRKPNPLHSTIGIPFGKGENRAILYGNSLYRIRTTKSYYPSVEQKDDNYPEPPMEIELWPKLYEVCSSQLNDWINQNDGVSGPGSSFHLDKTNKNPVKLIKIGTILKKNEVEEFEEILREGFLKLIDIER